ncbi:hypothetical protein D3C85_1201890 [compost metagenome]
MIPLIAATLEVVVALLPSIEVPSPALLIEKSAAALFSLAVKGSTKPPPPMAAGAHDTPLNFNTSFNAGATGETGLVCIFATTGFG